MTEPIIREIKPDEFDRVLDLLEAVAAEARWVATEVPIDRDQRKQRFTKDLADGTGITWIADSDGTFVGSAGIYRVVPGLYDLGMFVLKEWRRKGIGSALMRECIERAKALDAYKLKLEVWPHNEPAIKLYEKFGFEREGYFKKHWRRKSGEIWDSVPMGLVLD